MNQKTTRLIFGWLCWLLLFAFVTPSAFAHASLIHTSPYRGAVLKSTPQQVTLEYSEPLAPDLIDMKLYDWTRRQIDVPPAKVVPGHATQMFLKLPANLPKGTYTVVWNVVSEDGHPVSGSLPFSIGSVSADFLPMQQNASVFGNSGSWVLWLRYIVEGLTLLGGGLYAIAARAPKFGGPTFAQVLGRGRRIGWGILFLATLGEWFAYSAVLPGHGLTAALLQGNWKLFGQSPFAQMVLVQLLLLLLLLLPGMVRSWYALLWAALVAVLAFGGHGRAIEPIWLAVSVRVLHVLSLSAWMGALTYLLLAYIWQRRTKSVVDTDALRPYFLRTVLLGSLLVALSGIAMVTLQTDWITMLTGGALWSNLLIMKVLLLVLMLLLALIQTIRWRSENRPPSGTLLRIEWLIGIVVIFAAVWMSQIAYPPKILPYAATLTPQGQVAQGQATKATVNIDRLELGNRPIKLTVPDVNGVAPQKVIVQLVMEDMSMGDLDIPAQQTAPHQFQATLPLSMTGKWRFTVDAEYQLGTHVTWTDEFVIPKGE